VDREPIDPKATAEEFLQRSLRIIESNHGFFETLKANPDDASNPVHPANRNPFQET
jgi:hypothetical protein